MLEKFKTRKKETPPVRLFKEIQDAGLIKPGSVISKEMIERAFNMKYEENEQRIDLMLIDVHKMIKLHFFFVTTRGIDKPGFRILETEEMPDEAEKRLMRNLASNYEIATIMANHDTSELDEKSKKKFKLIQTQAAQTAILQQKVLFSNEMF